MTVRFTTDAERDLSRLDRGVANRIIVRLLWFADHFESQIPEPLSGPLRGCYKLRIGDWRVVYTLNPIGEQIVVRLINHRSKIYQRW